MKVFARFTSFILLSLLTSCGSKASYWDDDKNEFHITTENLTVHVPDSDEWIIADPENLPDNILYCGVMPDKGIANYLFVERYLFNGQDVYSIPKKSIEQLISEITHQSSEAGNVEYTAINTENTSFISKNAVKFNTIVRIDSMGIEFKGYIFSHNNRVMTYMTTEPFPTDSISQNIVNQILTNSITYQ